MKIWLRSFNIYLLAAGAVLGGGCGSSHLSAKKEYATLSIFMEGRPADSTPVEVGPYQTRMYIVPAAVLTEADLSKAKLVDNPDGTYAIELSFNDHGKLVLDMQTTANPGKHLIIFAKFPPKGWKGPPEEGAAEGKPPPDQPRLSAWLAAPMIPRNGIANGSLQFAPDATHAEAAQIVRGINNLVAELEK